MNPRLRRLLGLVGMSSLGLAVAVPVTMALTVWWFGRGAQDIDVSVLRDYSPLQTTTVVARDGTVLGEIHFEGQRRTVVSLEEIPKVVQQAFLAAEDADFFTHEGMDVLGMVRAAYVNVTSARLKQGASTITQQVVKNLLLSPERSVERKSKELLLSGRVETALGKRRILEIYLNEIYLGEGRYGVEAAARHYFGKSVGDLDAGEAAVLASLPKAPGKVTPRKTPQRVKERQRWVLRRMAEEGFLEAPLARAHMEAPLPVLEAARGFDSALAPEVVDAVRRQLSRRYDDDALARLGARVVTTVDPALQKRARDALRLGLESLAARHHDYGRLARPLSESARNRLIRRGPETLAVGQTVDAVVVESPASLPQHMIAAQAGRHHLVVTLPEGRSRQAFPAGHAISLEVLEGNATAASEPLQWAPAKFAARPEGAVVLLGVERAEVLAMISGRRGEPGAFNRALYAKRQPASAFKPMVYGAALALREITAATMLPTDHEDARPMQTARLALAHSDNGAAQAVLGRVGAEAVMKFAAALGITSSLRAVDSLALGTSEVTPFELASAYLALARGGRAVRPRIIDRIELPGGDILTEPVVAGEGIGADVAHVLTDMLTSVVEEGTAVAAQTLGYPVAGKTGTSDDARDAWFAGFTSQHAAVVWVGFDRRPSLGPRESGARAALPIWLQVMASANDAVPPAFEAPPGVHHELINDSTGGPACAPRTRVRVPASCTGWFVFRTCQPAHDVEVAPYLWCGDPKAWRREAFIEGTRPGPAVVSLASTGVRLAGLAIPVPPHEYAGELDENWRERAAPLVDFAQGLDRLWKVWSEGASARRRVVVHVEATAGGQVLDAHVVTSSGEQRVDAQALGAITASAVGPLDPALLSSWRPSVSFELEFSRQSASQ